MTTVEQPKVDRHSVVSTLAMGKSDECDCAAVYSVASLLPACGYYIQTVVRSGVYANLGFLD
ncbi:MAG: hypothetical protein ACAF41_09350 [Leptolyngbya sp. BL-A-14]